MRYTTIVLLCILASCTGTTPQKIDLNIKEYLSLGEEGKIYPSEAQIKKLEQVVPEQEYQPVPTINDRTYWDKIASTNHGKEAVDEALELIDKTPEVPISDETYRRANKEGNRGIYKPRYYRTMDRLEKYIIAECIENNGQFLTQIETYCHAIMEMKSWMHPNHDDNTNSVLEGRRVAIDLGARKFALVLSLAESLLEDKISENLETEIHNQLQWRIVDSYFKTCKGEDTVGNHWVKATSNWNSVCTSGTVFSTIVSSEKRNERLIAIGCALNSMPYYLSGFGLDGYCSEGVGYWGYGFGHYLYLAEILSDYTNGSINLFEFDCPEKLQNVANFPKMFEIQSGLYAPFSDGVTRVKSSSSNFASLMSAKYYGAEKPTQFVSDESVQTMIGWTEAKLYTDPNSKKGATQPENVTYFDDFGIVISRGTQPKPLSVAIKAGHNDENHNHSDVGTYSIVLGDEIVAGDIGAPSYTAGAFSKNNPARSSWGHPVPRINNKLQSNGKEYKGTIVHTLFEEDTDLVNLNIREAYDIPEVEILRRVLLNNKNGDGTIRITDIFMAERPITFGTAIMVNVDYEILSDNALLIHTEKSTVRVDIKGLGADVKITDEVVPVKSLRSGKTSYRIGIDFVKPVNRGSITVKYTPVS